jgi:hypothetical protein
MKSRGQLVYLLPDFYSGCATGIARRSGDKAHWEADESDSE